MKGKKAVILLLRPEAESRDAINMIRSSGLGVVAKEAIKIKCNSIDKEKLCAMASAAAYVIFSSRNAVHCMETSMPALKKCRSKVFASGTTTAGLLKGLGVRVAFAPRTGGISKIIARLLAERLKGKIVVVFGSNLSKNDYGAILSRGATVEEAHIYDTLINKVELSPKELSSITHVMLFSPSEVEALRASIDAQQIKALKSKTAICIGRATYDTAKSLFRIRKLAGSNTVKGAIKMVNGG